MNRADIVRSILIWDRVAKRAQAVAADLRDQLADDARAEYVEQGTAPTWRLPDLATVTLAVSKRAVVVDDEDALTRWAAERRPDDVETIVRYRPASLTALLAQVGGDEVPCLDDGEAVPGLAVREGGQPRHLSVRAAPEATGLLDDAAAGVLAAIASAMGEPVGLETPETAA